MRHSPRTAHKFMFRIKASSGEKWTRHERPQWIPVFLPETSGRIVVMFVDHPGRMKLESLPDASQRNKSGGRAPHSKVFTIISYLECGALPPLLFPRLSQRNPATPKRYPPAETRNTKHETPNPSFRPEGSADNSPGWSRASRRNPGRALAGDEASQLNPSSHFASRSQFL